MLDIANYTVKEELHHSPNSIVYRGERIADGQAVILKLMTETYPTSAQVARFQREYHLGQKLTLPQVVAVYELLPLDHRWLIVVEDFGGESLKRLALAGQISLPQWLKIALKTAQALGSLHAKQIIHKDINPANIVYNPKTAQLKLIDLGIATELAREEVGFRSPNRLEGTLAYLSPEQTGRMNRAIDYRTDFYSLGVTLYELLTGQLPFEAADPLGMVHAHLALQPTPPTQLRPDVPEIISQLILKLMAKEAEQRYHSAWGVVADLRHCLEHDSALTNLQFTLGQADLVDHLVLTDQLYGRQQEVAHLERMFAQVQAGESQLGLITGQAGVGKTALVKELYRVITQKRGYFIEGKYDQFKRDVPYHGLLQAIDGLIEQLLQEEAASYAHWQQIIQTALGETGQVLVDLIPRLEQFIGSQPSVPELGPLETQNRLTYVLNAFVGCFLEQEQSLVIFLDDLQWIDSGSLDLLKQLVTDTRFKRLLILGAYRDNEVSAGLSTLLQSLKEAKQSLKTITLAPLPLTVITDWLGEVISHPSTKVVALANLLLQKSGGNPFFMRELLKQLYLSEQLYFDGQAGQWAWDISAIEALELSDNVVSLLTGQLQQLPYETQRVLQHAACIGNSFKLGLLAIVLEHSVIEVADWLHEALLAEIIIPLDDRYRYIQADGSENVGYRFAHDRLQKTAYDLLTTQEQTQLHWRIGQLLQPDSAPDYIGENLLEIVHHLNLGISLIANETERLQVIQLNEQAAQRARASGAFKAMHQYITLGLGLHQEQDWNHTYELTLRLHLSGAEANYLVGQFTQTEALVTTGVAQATSNLDKARLQLVQLKAYNLQTMYGEAVQLGLSLLSTLGEKLPTEPTEQDVEQTMAQTKALWQEQSINDLVNLPTMTKPERLMITALLSELVASAYLSNPKLFVLIVCQSVRQSILYGNSRDGAYGYVAYGILMSSNDIPSAYAFGKLGLQLIEKYAAREQEARALNIFGALIEHWCESFATCLPTLKKGEQIGLENGDFEYAGYASANYAYMHYLTGQSLANVAFECEQTATQFGQMFNKTALAVNNIAWQVVLNLYQGEENPTKFCGPVLDEQEQLPAWEADHDVSILAALYNYKFLLAYLFEAYDEALQLLPQVEQYYSYVAGLVWMGVVPFYEALLYLAIYHQASSDEQVTYLEKVSQIQDKLRHWATHAPMNYQHKYDLVEAERLRVIGEYWQASELYDQAITEAQTNGFQQEAALANELVGKFYLNLGKNRVGQTYLYEATYLYERWGATRKVNQLRMSYPFLTRPHQTGNQHYSTANLLTTTDGYTGRTTLSNLDTETVIKAMQAISQEIELAPLLTQLLQVIVENAGAERGLLLLPQANSWTLEAEFDQNEIAVLQHQPLNQIDGHSATPKLSGGVVTAVIRQQKAIVLSDASQEGPFMTCEFVRQTQPKSILSVPLLNQHAVIGVLYLENNLLTNAFTPKHIELVRLLGTQAAISISNAQTIALRAEAEKAAALAKAAEAEAEKATAIAQAESEKAAALATLNQVSQQLTGILKVDDLLQQIVTQTKEQFNYYHSHIYLMNDTHDILVMTAGYGDPGATMKANHHHIPTTADKSLVARAARELAVIQVDHVQQEPDWLPNPLLPNTRSEIAVPIVQAGQCVGVLDVQSDTIAGLSNSDADLLQSLANQIAVALTNARLFEQTEAAKQQADEANQAKSEFLSNMSHELRTPLNGILGYTQILNRKANLNQEVSDGLKIIQQSGHHLLTLINDILDLSKIEARKMELYPAPVQLPTFIEGVVGIMLIKAQEKDIYFQAETNNLPLGALIDEKRLRQVLLNLTSNAVKFTDQGGVTLRIIELANGKMDGWADGRLSDDLSMQIRKFADTKLHYSFVRFEVEDTGIGMSPEALEKIFEAFEQVGDFKKRGEGTGLGLAITKQLVELMGGDLQVRSQEGQGTTFWFEIILPITQVSDDAISHETVEQIIGYDGPSRKILIAEDNLNNRLMLLSLLEPLGFELLEATDGLEALELTKQYQPDLIITDSVMPRMTGIELMTHIRNIPSLAQTAILLVSAVSVDVFDQTQAVGQSDGFLTKPIDINHLLTLIGDCLGLSWQYHKPTNYATLDNAPMQLPPQATLEQLWKAAERGGMRKIQKIAKGLLVEDGPYRLFAKQLLRLANQYDDKGILTFLNQFDEFRNNKS